MKTLAMRPVALCLVAIVTACGDGSQVGTATMNWAGAWEYASNPGSTVGGSPITMHYRLIVAEPGTVPAATLVIRGFQTDKTLLCDVDAMPARLTVRFRSYDDGGTLNAYGVEEYHRGETLVTLTRDDAQQLDLVTTDWQGLDPPQESGARKGTYFQKVNPTQ